MLYMHEIQEDMLEVTQLPITGEICLYLSETSFHWIPVGDLTMEYDVDIKNQTLQLSDTPNSSLQAYQQVYSGL